MFLEEIEKDEIGYVEYCKNKVKEYFVNFFDKKYEKQIEHKINRVHLIFLDKCASKMCAQDSFSQNKYISKFYNKLYKVFQRTIFKDYSNFISEFNTSGCYCSIGSVDNEKDSVEYIIYEYITSVTQSAFVHELLHCISSQVFLHEHRIYRTNEDIERACKSGLKFNFITKNKYIIIKNKLLNEVFTDYVAINITDQMCKDNLELFSKKITDSIYSYCFVLIKPLFDKYFDAFKDFYLNDDETKLDNFFGKENINELDDILNNFLGYSKSLDQKGVLNRLNCNTFKDGLNERKTSNDKEIKIVLKKYYNSFVQMKNLMEKIDTHVEKNKFDWIMQLSKNMVNVFKR